MGVPAAVQRADAQQVGSLLVGKPRVPIEGSAGDGGKTGQRLRRVRAVRDVVEAPSGDRRGSLAEDLGGLADLRGGKITREATQALYGTDRTAEAMRLLDRAEVSG